MQATAVARSLVGLVLEWRPAASYAGYGTSVIRNLVPYELDGTVDYLLQM
jgi:hypothetical protein